jgi:septum site-determining protein MinC
MNDLATPIRIKGMRDGLLVSLPEGEWSEQSKALLSQIDGQEAFFRGARLALDVGGHAIKVNEMVELRDKLSERNVSLWAVISESPTTEKTAQLLGLATRVSKPRPEEMPSLDGRTGPEESALFLKRTLRSGTRIEYPGSVVVLGDVNPGAEMIAEGSVIVWGRLRGVVHAGSAGDQAAVVCALDLAPMRLQIADEVWLLGERKDPSGPEMAVVREGAIVLEPWESGGTGQA